MKRLLLLLLILTTTSSLDAQNISGDQLVVPSYAEHVYTITATIYYPSSAHVEWSVTGGTITESNNQYCKVIWENQIGVGTLSFTESLNNIDGSIGVYIGIPYLPAQLEVAYSTSPGINVYSLPKIDDATWEKSLDNVNWTSVATGTDYYSLGSVTSNFYLRVKLEGYITYYTNTCYVYVPPLNVGTIYLTYQPPYNTAPPITSAPAIPGLCVTLQYEWELSYNGMPWQVIGNNESFPSNQNIIANDVLYVRRKVICGTTIAYSNTLRVVPAYVTVDFENLTYVRENTIVIPGVTSWYQADQLPSGQKFQSTNYLDGYARTIQTVSKQTAKLPNNTFIDNVAIYQFDELGRQDKTYLPFVSANNIGKFKSNSQAEQETYIQSKFADNGNSFGKAIFEKSSLSRVTKTMLPGTAWGNSGIGKDYSYGSNNTNEIIKVWEIGFSENDKPYTIGNYEPKTLFKKITIDEKGKRIVEYEDFNGNIVFSKVQDLDEHNSAFEENGYGGWLCTYYVYDDFGRLRYTISPKAVNALGPYTSSSTHTISSDIAKELCFQNFYDADGRIIVKSTPGGGSQEIVYDQRSRVIFTRGADDAEKNRWFVNVCDGYNRDQIKGFFNNATYTRNYLANFAASVEISPFSVTNSTSANDATLNHLHISFREPWKNLYIASESIEFLPGFESSVDGLQVPNDDFIAEIGTATPTIQTQVLTTWGNFIPSGANLITLGVNYYDDYSYSNAKAFSFNYSLPSTPNPYVSPTQKAKRTFGSLTGRKLRIIDDENYANDGFLLTTMYYDERGNVIQQLSDNYLHATDILTSQYDYAGKLLGICLKETISGTALQNFPVITKYEYDELGRVNLLSKSYNNSSFKPLIGYAYDETGQLINKKLSPGYNNGAGLETLEYKYNIHGWLSSINENFTKTNSSSSQWQHYFGEIVDYESAQAMSPQHNGNISGVSWKTQGDNIQRRYDYDYTNAGYLKQATFTQYDAITQLFSSSKQNFSVPIVSYDENGNIKVLKQYGLIPGHNSSSMIDDLTYSYGGINQLTNRLIKVIDNATTGTANGSLGDFKNSNPVQDIQYSYTPGGNLKIDRNKPISENGSEGINYNILNKPYKVVVEGKQTINYVYDAAGQKLATKITNTSVIPNTSMSQYFINDVVVEDGQIQYFVNETGRLRVSQLSSFGFTPAPSLTLGGNNGLLIDGKPAFYDFFILDHLQSTRVVLTEEDHVEFHKATMEISNTRQKEYEERMFGAIDAYGKPKTTNELISTRTVGDMPNGWNIYDVQSNVKATKLTQTQPIGPNAFFKVMAGDKFQLYADYYYDQQPQSGGNVWNTIIASLIGAFSTSHSSASLKDFSVQLNNQLNNSSDFTAILQNPTGAGLQSPNAHVNWLFFDENFNPISQGATRVGSTAGSGLIHEPEIKVPSNGYAFIYLSNSSNTPVWFDNFSIEHTRGRILQEHHYYPFGLEIKSISGKSAGKLNNFNRYQGNFSTYEEQTSLNDFELRSYEPQLGRWTGIDPYDQFFSGYVAFGGDPVNNIDPNGGSILSSLFEGSLASRTLQGALLGSIVGGGIGVLTKDEENIGRGLMWGALIGGAGTYLFSSPTNINVQFVPNWKQVDKDVKKYGLFKSAYLGGKLRSIFNEIVSLGKIVTITGDSFIKGTTAGDNRKGTLTENLVRYFNRHPNAKAVANAYTEFHSGSMGDDANHGPDQFKGISKYFNSNSTFLYGNCFQALRAEATSAVLNGATVIGSYNQQLDLPFLLQGTLSGNPLLVKQSQVVKPSDPVLNAYFMKHRIARSGKVIYDGRATTKITTHGKIIYEELDEKAARRMNNIFYRLGSSFLKNFLYLIKKIFQ